MCRVLQGSAGQPGAAEEQEETGCLSQPLHHECHSERGLQEAGPQGSSAEGHATADQVPAAIRQPPQNHPR